MPQSETEIQHLDPEVLGDHDVVGFQISMDNAAVMCSANSICQRNGKLENLARLHTSLRDQLREGLALHKFHRDEVDLVGLLDGEDGHDVGVAERGDGFRLALKSVQTFGRDHFRGKNFIATRRPSFVSSAK